MASYAIHRSILVVDVEQFGAAARTNADQIAVREAMYQALRRAFGKGGIAWDSCVVEDRGDGALILIPPEIPKARLVTSMPVGLAAALHAHNATSPAASQIRLRLAVHGGEVHPDAYGVTGSTVNHTFRLVDSAPLKRALATSPVNLAMVASDWFYHEVIRHHPDATPDAYRPVRVIVKETDALAWICLPELPAAGQPTPPSVHTGQKPAQLSHDVRGFTGRARELAQLHELASDTVVISAIDGAAGIGKTALAIHFGHQVADRFPDGQLYVDLHGFDPNQPQRQPGDVLVQFLTALGADTQHISSDLDTRVSMYRSMLANKRVLIVLDNAATVEQVRPLLPGSGVCLVLVTSRNRLSGLVVRDGAHRVTLGLLTSAEARELITRIIGQDRAEPAELDELARLCGYLPLALRIAAERVALHPHNTVASLIDELTESRLDVLSVDDEQSAMRAVLSWSYLALKPEPARMFRLLGLHAGIDISVPAAAALADVREPDARRLLDSLAALHLVEECRPNRYWMHDLVRCYATERAESSDDSRQAIGRVLAWYLHTADASEQTLAPNRRPLAIAEPRVGVPVTFSTSGAAIRWCTSECTNLVASVYQAAELGFHSVAWRLPILLGEYFLVSRCWDDWLTTHHLGLASARRSGERQGEALILTNLGLLYVKLNRFAESLRHSRLALLLLRQLDDHLVEGVAMTNMGLAYAGLRRFDEAVTCHQEALALHRKSRHRWGESWALTNLGIALAGLHRFGDAIEAHEQAAAIQAEVGNWVEGLTHTYLGQAHTHLGRFTDAVHHYHQALAVHRHSGNLWGEAEAQHHLGVALAASGDRTAARTSWQEAFLIFTRLDPAQAAVTRALLEPSSSHDRDDGEPGHESQKAVDSRIDVRRPPAADALRLPS